VRRKGLYALGPLAAYLAVVLPNARFVPLWDSSPYAECVVSAVASPFNLLSFGCFNHPSIVYLFLVGLGQYVDLGNSALLVVVNAALGCLGLFAFHRIASLLAKDEPFLALAAAFALAFHPVFLATTVFLNSDFGVVVFFLATLAALLEGRILLTALAGLGLVFSKETGLLLYVTAIGLHGLFALHAAARSAWPSIVRRLSPLAVPVFAFAFYFVLKLTTNGGAAVWVPPTYEARDSVLKMFITFRFDLALLAYLQAIFVLSFAWVTSGIVFLWAVVTAVRAVRRRGTSECEVTVEALESGRLRRFLVVLVVVSCYLLTRYQTFLNVRYFLPLYPLLLLLAVVMAVQALLSRPLERVVVAVAVAALNLVSAHRTVDPVSKMAFGTFPFGEHPILRMTAPTRECCGFGRDQLVYNLEFVRFHDAVDELFRTTRPRQDAILTAHAQAVDWYMVGAIDTATYGRTIRPKGSYKPKVAFPEAIVRGRLAPDELTFIVFPNFDNRLPLSRLAPLYVPVRVSRYGKDGYFMDVLTLARRRPPMAAFRPGPERGEAIPPRSPASAP